MEKNSNKNLGKNSKVKNWKKKFFFEKFRLFNEKKSGFFLFLLWTLLYLSFMDLLILCTGEHTYQTPARTELVNPHLHRTRKWIPATAPRPQIILLSCPHPHRVRNYMSATAPQPQIFSDSCPQPPRISITIFMSAKNPHRICK